MKNIFKFMAIALVSFSMIACGDKDNTEDNNGGNGGGSDTPTATYKITWGDAVQTLGYTDAYKYSASAQSYVYILDAAQGIENEQYQLPRFRFGFDLDTDPQYGCTLTAQWGYGESMVPGNYYFPTDVFENGAYADDYAYDQMVGDWQLNWYDDGADFHLTNAQFDATTRTLSGSITVQMYSYEDVYDYYVTNEIEEPTEADFLAALTASTKKNLKVELTNFVFAAASSK
jgi:hypothetical protein